MRYVRAASSAWLCVLLLIGGVSCGRAKEASQDGPDPVIATVDGREIRASALVAEYETVPEKHRAHYAANRHELLDFIINRAVIVAEARAAGLDSDPAVIERLRKAREFATETGLSKSERFDALLRQAEERILILAMRERVVGEAKTPITDEELRALAAEMAGGDLPTEFIELRAIVNADRGQVEAAQAELAAGKAFDKVHAAYSTEKNQHLATYSDTTLGQMAEPLRAAVQDVEDGGLTDAFEMNGRFYIVHVTRRPAIVNLEPWRRQLLAQKHDEHFGQWVAERRADHRIVVNTKRLEEVQLPEAPAVSTTANP